MCTFSFSLHTRHPCSHTTYKTSVTTTSHTSLVLYLNITTCIQDWRDCNMAPKAALQRKPTNYYTQNNTIQLHTSLFQKHLNFKLREKFALYCHYYCCCCYLDCTALTLFSTLLLEPKKVRTRQGQSHKHLEWPKPSEVSNKPYWLIWP